MNQQKQYLNKNKKKNTLIGKSKKIRFAYIIGEQEEVDKTF